MYTLRFPFALPPGREIAVTDSAGVTCQYTAVEDLKPGDAVILGWRSVVKRIDIDEGAGRVRIMWEGWPHWDQWLRPSCSYR